METEQTGFRMPWWAKVLMGFAVLVLLGLGTVYVMGIAERGRWESYAASLREAGEPLTFAEIEARRAEVPDEENSALVIEDALKKYPPNPSEFEVLDGVLVVGYDVEWEDTSQPIPRYSIEPSQAYLEKHRARLDALSPILERPTGRVARNSRLLATPSSFRQVVKLARLDSVLMLVDGDWANATDGAVLQFHLAASMDECPHFFGPLTAQHCDYLAMKTTGDILRAGMIAEAELLRLREVLRTRKQNGSMHTTWLAERAFAVEFYDLLARGETTINNPFRRSTMPVPTPALLPEFIVRRNQIRAVELLTELVNTGDDTVAMYDAALSLDSELARMGRTLFIAQMMTPSLGRAVFLQLQNEIVLDCTLVGIAAERFRMVNARFPASISDLVPEYLETVPADPFDNGKPLKMATADGELVFYSIGENGIDDGGDITKAQNPLLDTPDIGFRLLDPEHRGVVITDEPRPDDD